MILEIIINYSIVILALILAVGAINVYYFFGFFLKKENRKKLFNVWLLALSAMVLHSVAHLVESFVDLGLVYPVLELSSLILGAFIMAIIGRDTLNLYTFVNTKKRLEKEVDTRTQDIEHANIELKQEIIKHTKTEDALSRKIEELERWQKLTVGREQKMIELKEEIKKLKKEGK